MINRGDIYWMDFGEPEGSLPAKRRPVVVVQSDKLNASRISTVLIAVITSSTSQADMPGNVFLSAGLTGLPKDSVVNVSQIMTVNRFELVDRAGQVPSGLMHRVSLGLRVTLAI